MENQILSLTINSKELQRAIGVAGKSVIENPIVPILSCVLFDVKTTGKIILTGSDLQVTVSSKTDALTIEAEEDQKIGVPYNLLSQLLSTLPNGPLTLDFTKTELPGQGSVKLYNISLSLTFETDNYEIPCEDGIDFPNTPKFEGARKLKIKSNDLSQAIAMVGHLVSTSEYNPALSGMFVDVQKEETTFVGIDGHLGGIFQLTQASEEEYSFILPPKFIKLIVGIIPTQIDSEVTLVISEKNVKVQHGDWQVVSSLIEDKYPNYKGAIQTNFNISTNIDLGNLKTILKRSLIFSNKENRLEFNFSGDNLYVISSNAEQNKKSNQDMVIGEPVEDFKIGFNGKFMNHIVSKISGEVEIKMSEHNRPMFIYPPCPENEKLTLFITPIILLT